MTFQPTNQKAIIVATNYDFRTHDDFWETLNKKNYVDKYQLVKVDLDHQGDVPPEEILNQMIDSFPLQIVSESTKVQLIHIGLENKLLIEKSNYEPSDYENFKSLSNDIIDLKSLEVRALGLNYSADFNLGKIKLQLLSESVIDDIPDFKQNLTFEFVLPIEYKEENLVATYKVKKIKGEGTENSPRIYNISVNFHFNLTEIIGGQEKLNKLKDILNSNYYDRFIKQCEGFLKLNDSKEF